MHCKLQVQVEQAKAHLTAATSRQAVTDAQAHDCQADLKRLKADARIAAENAEKVRRALNKSPNGTDSVCARFWPLWYSWTVKHRLILAWYHSYHSMPGAKVAFNVCVCDTSRDSRVNAFPSAASCGMLRHRQRAETDGNLRIPACGK